MNDIIKIRNGNVNSSNNKGAIHCFICTFKKITKKTTTTTYYVPQ